jgi:hypothetical protein
LVKGEYVMKKLLLLSILSLNVLGNDPLSSLQWGIKNSGQPVFRSTGELTREFIKGTSGEDIGYPADLKLSSKKVIVAVIDSGVDIEHPDLKENIWNNPICDEATEEEKLTLDCHGWNFLDGNNDLTDDIGHGTHVAGIIGAVEGNKIGIKGVAARNVEIMPLKILNSKVNSFVYEKKVITNIIADAIAYAIKNGATVINLSLGWPKLIHTRKVRFAIDKAIAKNIPIIVASGNNNKQVPVYPCSYNEVICVGAMDNNGNIPEFSNFGGKVDIVAPGEGIISTYPRNLESRLLRIPGYEFKKGSSQAAPFVSGVIALIKSLNNEISLDEIKYKLYKSVKSLEDSKSIKFGKISLKNFLNTKVDGDLAQFDFKSLTEVVIKEDGSFKFNLPVRALVNDIDSLDFKVEIGEKDDLLLNKSFSSVKVLQNKSRNMLISGKVLDFSKESHAKLRVFANSKVYSHQIAFVREMSKVKKAKFKSTIATKNLITIKSGRKFSRLRKVISTNHYSDSSDYFFEQIGDFSDTKVQLMKIKANSVKDLSVSIDKVSKVLNVIKNDFNFDGASDYMIYSLGKEKLNLILTFVNSDGTPLYKGLSNWKLPISDFEGLPFFNGEIKFELLKVNVEGVGLVKVPTFMKTWRMPEEDNTLDPLDRISADQPTKRPYYLLPKVVNGNVVLEVRTLSSYGFLEKFREEQSISRRDELYFDSIITQNLVSSKSGEVSTVVVSGREFAKKYFEITYSTPEIISVKEIDLWGRSLESNKTLISDDLHSFERASFGLVDRKKIRSQFWNNESVEDTLEFSTESWGDLIIDVLNFATSKIDKALFIESRYFIHVASTNGDKFKLPINRESSFPGVNFSETMKNIKIQSDEGLESALLIDSSLIYGDRLYAMVYNGVEFSSPIYSSFRVPTNCKHIDTINLESGSSLVMTCLERDGSASVEVMKLEKRVE